MRRKGIYGIWALLSLAPIGGPFAAYYVMLSEFYGLLREEMACLIEHLSLIKSLREELDVSLSFPYEDKILKRLEELRALKPKTALTQALIMALLDVTRILALRGLRRDLKAYLKKEMRLPTSIMLLIIFMIGGAARGILSFAGYWPYIMPSMSLIQLTWLTAIPFEMQYIKLQVETPLAFILLVFSESLIISLIHFDLLRRVNEAIKADHEFIKEIEDYDNELREAMRSLEDYRKVPPPPAESRLCANCKGEVPLIARYCPHCGAKLTETGEPKEERKRELYMLPLSP